MGWCKKRLSAVPAPPPLYRHIFSSALGGRLFRAGRIDEAIARLKEGLAASTESGFSTDWAYLALAYERTGRLAEAHE
jgi:predicted Zn-dependent protease